VDVSVVDVHTVWTEWWRSNQFISNEYVSPDESGEITGYYITPKPWTGEAGEAEIITVIWEDCEMCEGTGEDEEGEECSDCDGEATIKIDLFEELGE
jgi:hypothetical protein